MTGDVDSPRQPRFGPFVTFVEVERPDGLVARWETRRYRKHGPTTAPDGATWWAPRARGWWIAVLFAIGSVLFALGVVPAYAEQVGLRWDAGTLFVGSLFFTGAGFLQYREAVDSTPSPVGPEPAGPSAPRRRVLTWQPRRIEWLATAVQLVGTLCFNVSTGYALEANLTVRAAQQHVWRPDAIGSVCFLVASALAWFEVCHGWTGWKPSSLAWWITLANLVGSVAFGVSSVAGYLVSSTGDAWNAQLSNLGTFVGALCFLGGAVLLMPERTEPT